MSGAGRARRRGLGPPTGYGTGVSSSERASREQLGQPVVAERGRRVELRERSKSASKPYSRSPQAIIAVSCGQRCRVVAERVVARLRRGQRADPPAREQRAITASRIARARPGGTARPQRPLVGRERSSGGRRPRSRCRVPAGRARVLRRGGLARARRRAPLLGTADATSWFLIVLDALRRRGAGGRARAGAGAPPAGWLRAARSSAGGGCVRYGPRRGGGGLAQQGWRDAMAPVEDHPPAAASCARTARRRARRSPTPTARPPPWRRSTRSRGSIPAATGRRARRPARAARGLGAGRAGGGGRRRGRAGRRLALGWLLWAGALAGAPRRRRPTGCRLPDVLTASGCATLCGERRRVPPARLPSRRRLAVRPWLGYGGLRAAGGTPRPSASAPACSRRSTGSGDRRHELDCRGPSDGALEPDRGRATGCQAWTVGRALGRSSTGWDGRRRPSGADSESRPSGSANTLS